MALITTAQARRHLRLPDEQGSPADEDEYTLDVALKMEQATAYVLAHMHIDDDALAVLTWTDDTDPASDLTFAIVQGAILEVLANIFFDRGDREKPSDGPITPRVKNSLSMQRKPTIA